MKNNMVEANEGKNKEKRGLKQIIVAALILGIGATTVYSVSAINRSNEGEVQLSESSGSIEKFEIPNNENINIINEGNEIKVLEGKDKLTIENELLANIDRFVEKGILTEEEGKELSEVEGRVNSLYEKVFNEKDENKVNEIYLEIDKIYEENNELYSKVYNNPDSYDGNFGIQGCIDTNIQN